MGMRPTEFWNMPPFLFYQKVDGYFRRQNRAGIYFRETLAFHANINRKEGSPPILGEDIIQLPMEKKKRKPRQISSWTDEMIVDYTERINRQHQAELAAKAEVNQFNQEPP